VSSKPTTPDQTINVSSTNSIDELRLDQWADMLGIGAKAVLTTRETASVLRVSEKSVREGIKDGTIPCIRIGRRLLVPVPMLLSSLLRGPTSNELHK